MFCTIARDQIDAGNYEAACAVLQRWWTFGEWPKVEGLSQRSSADLLLTTGMLTGWLGSTKQLPRAQKYAEALINGAIGTFEQLGSKARRAEESNRTRIVLLPRGSFDLARSQPRCRS